MKAEFNSIQCNPIGFRFVIIRPLKENKKTNTWVWLKDAVLYRVFYNGTCAGRTCRFPCGTTVGNKFSVVVGLLSATHLHQNIIEWRQRKTSLLSAPLLWKWCVLADVSFFFRPSGRLTFFPLWRQIGSGHCWACQSFLFTTAAWCAPNKRNMIDRHGGCWIKMMAGKNWWTYRNTECFFSRLQTPQ